jgi:hypothetical protein
LLTSDNNSTQKLFIEHEYIGGAGDKMNRAVMDPADKDLTV